MTGVLFFDVIGGYSAAVTLISKALANGLEDIAELLAAKFKQRPHMFQPFIQSKLSEGEYSLFFFAQDYSHCILKRPASVDFRVQEEHGGRFAG